MELQTAKEILEMVGKGINPNTGEIYPEITRAMCTALAELLNREEK